jgi:hypothetical protein
MFSSRAAKLAVSTNGAGAACWRCGVTEIPSGGCAQVYGEAVENGGPPDAAARCGLLRLGRELSAEHRPPALRLFPCAWSCSTSQCSTRTASAMRTMSAAIQLRGCPVPENLPWTIPNSSWAKIRPASYRSAASTLRVSLNRPSQPWRDMLDVVRRPKANRGVVVPLVERRIERFENQSLVGLCSRLRHRPTPSIRGQPASPTSRRNSFPSWTVPSCGAMIPPSMVT